MLHCRIGCPYEIFGLVTMRNNALDKINGAVELGGILESIESAETADELAELTEKLHAVNHTLLDSLEGR